MASRHYTPTVTIAAGVTQANATETAITLDPGHVRRVTLVTPGVTGTGVAVAYAHQIVIPYAGSQWIVSSGTSQNFAFDMDDYGESGSWSVFGYNTSAGQVIWSVFFAVDRLTSTRERSEWVQRPLPLADIYTANIRVPIEA